MPAQSWTRRFPAKPGAYWIGWTGAAHLEPCQAIADGDGRVVLRRHGYMLPVRPGDLPPETRYLGPLPVPKAPVT